MYIAFSYLVRGGQKIRKDTRTHQERHLAIDAVTAAVLAERKQEVRALLATTNVKLVPTAYVFASDPLGLTPWNPDWVTHKVTEVAEGAGVSLNIKALRHYADPVSEVDRRAAAYLAQLTAHTATSRAAPPAGLRSQER